MTIRKSILPALFIILLSTTAFAAVKGPVKSITLSSGGLAEIVRTADVDKEAEITIDVPLDQIDDVLKSLIVRDDKGAVKNLSLSGPNPLEETFRTLPFKPADLTSMPKLLDAIKGTQVAAGDKQGVVLGVTATDGEKEPMNWQLSLLMPGGEIAMLPIPGTKIEILDETVKANLQTAMSVIAKGNTDGARTVTIKLGGETSRQVDLSYVVPAPIWKTSYRLVTGDDGNVRLQAWAVFENASGEDWNDVNITLSSGRPVTLRQALFQRFMKNRTEVAVDTSAVQLRRARSDIGGALGTQGAAKTEALLAAPAPMMEAADAQNFAMAGVAAAANATEGDVTSTFALPGVYDVKNGETVSLPIIDKGVKAKMVSLYRQDRGSDHPVAAALIENDSGISLPQGILTVYDGKAGYVGDAQITGLPTGKEQAITYAVDQKVSIDTDLKQAQTVVSVKVVDGMIHAKSTLLEATEYAITGPNDAERTVLIEVPRRNGWTFSSPDTVDPTSTDYRVETKLAAGEKKVIKTTLESVIDEVYALADANAQDILRWGTAADPETKEKLEKLAQARKDQNNAQVKLDMLDQDYQRVSETQARARENLQALREGDHRTRFENQLVELEIRLQEIENSRAEQRTVIDDYNEKVGSIIRTF